MSQIDLTYLNTMAGGDEEIIQEMIILFIEQVPEFIENFKKHLKEKDYIALGKEAHKAKSSVLIMGMTDLATDLKNLQLITIAGINKETYPLFIKKFEYECLEAIKELKKK